MRGFIPGEVTTSRGDQTRQQHGSIITLIGTFDTEIQP